MSALDGKQFFAHEIQPVLGYAANTAINLYQETDDSSWLSANVAIVGVKTRINSQVIDEEYRGPQIIRKGSSLWAELDAVLDPVSDYQQVREAIAQLPDDVMPLAGGPSWLRPVLAVAGVAAVGGLGYWWARKA